MQKSLIGLVMSLLLAGPTWAIDYPKDPSLTYGPFVFEPGVSTTETLIVRALPHTTRYLMLWCPEPGAFTDPVQRITYMWQECPINDREGLECRDWMGGSILGGPFIDKQGNPQRCAGSLSSPRCVGKPFRVRLRVDLMSATPVEMTLQVVPLN